MPRRSTLAAPPTPPQIGNYQIVDRIATGGMADVFLAVDRRDPHAQPVVVKRILANLAQDETFIRMFLQEARIAMAVDHPNVVRIRHLSEEGGLPYLVMDYVDGLTFRQLARAADDAGYEIPPEVAIDLVMQASTGAHAVHQTDVGGHAEIVHRDLCPHNLMVDPEGGVRLLDFGIAKAAQGMDTTRTGVLKGKTSYLAPEQVRSAAVDRRTDLWALSVVLWELLAGRKMFEEEAEFDILQRIAQGDVPRLDIARPDLPAALVETVHHSLQVRPDDRFPDALALREALGRAARGAGLDPSRERTAEVVRSLQQGRAPAMTAPPPAAPAPRRTALWIAAFVVAAIAVFAVGIASSAWLIAPRPLVGDPVRMTFAPILPPAEMAAELEPLRADLEIALGRPVLVQIAPTYAATAALLQSGQTEIAVLPPRLFLDVEARMGDRLRPLAVTEVDRARGVDAVLIARRDLAWAGAETMRGRTLCLTDPASATGYALPLRWLADAGIGVADLAGTVESGDHHQVIRDVASGKCDVGAVYSSALRGAADTDVPVHLTRQVEVTGSTPNDAVCAGPGSDPELEAALKAALLAWDPQRTRGTRVVGSRLRLTGFVAFDASEYAPLRAALAPPEPAPGAP